MNSKGVCTYHTNKIIHYQAEITKSLREFDQCEHGTPEALHSFGLMMEAMARAAESRRKLDAAKMKAGAASSHATSGCPSTSKERSGNAPAEETSDQLGMNYEAP